MKLVPETNQNDPLLTSDNDNLLSLQNEIKALQLDSHDRELKIEQLNQELERLRLNQKDLLSENARATVETLYSNLAPIIVQLVTQNYLSKEQNKAIQPKDILLITERLIRTLEQNGLKLLEQPGQQVRFDPNVHLPISAASSFLSGQLVIVRFIGISYQGKILRKAVVEAIEGAG
ncbi:MAG TPA: nucleotide exchange factor GrpE [Anaerolineaceae bacterium]|nr:nucleotide exchange factor GrpE [Anaerolineaceae bacterium]